MPNARFKKLAPEKQARILDAATRAFAEHGLEGASINRILAEAGLSKGAAYYYFEDKADLFGTVARRCWEAFMEHVNFSVEGLTARSFWPRVETIMQHACEHMTSDPVMTTMAKAVWHMDTRQGACRVMDDVVAFSHAWIGEMVRKGQALGVVRTDLPTELLIALATALDQATDQWMVESADRLPSAKVTEIAMRVFASTRQLLLPMPAKRRAR
jgi:AcrR family transcriptional regulator